MSSASRAGSCPLGSVQFTTKPAGGAPRSLHDMAVITERPRAPILLVVTITAGIAASLIRSATK